MSAPTQPRADSRAAQQVAVAVAAQQTTSQIRANLLSQIAALWRSLGSYRNADMARFVRQAVPLVQAAQRQMGAASVASLSVQRRAVLGRSVNVSVPSSSMVDLRMGVDPVQVYERPFHLVWRQLDSLPREVGSIEKAIDAGLARAQILAATDVQLTKQHVTQAVFGQDERVVGYRRVLEGAYSCGLCIVASTQRYHRENLLPCHPGCDCSVAPIYGTEDPGQIINAPQLDAIHNAIFATFGNSSAGARSIGGTQNDKGDPIMYRDVLVQHDNSELGPVLAVRGAPFLSF